MPVINVNKEWLGRINESKESISRLTGIPVQDVTYSQALDYFFYKRLPLGTKVA